MEPQAHNCNCTTPIDFTSSNRNSMQYSDSKEETMSEPKRQLTPNESAQGEIIEDDGEVFKSGEGQRQFRTLGM